jgi:membrane protein insertase Oxa1/YidC/SpoIIIJ
LFLIGMIGMLLFNGYGSERRLLSKFTLLLAFAWVCNAGFSIFVSPITLRYQLFPVLSGLAMAVILMSTIYQLGMQQAALEKQAANQKLKLA